MNNLKIDVSHPEAHIMIVLKGNITSLDALKLREELDQIVDIGKDIILDLQEIEDIDLTGFNAILMTHVRTMKKGTKFRIDVPPKHCLHKYIEMTHHQGLMQIS